MENKNLSTRLNALTSEPERWGSWASLWGHDPEGHASRKGQVGPWCNYKHKPRWRVAAHHVFNMLLPDGSFPRLLHGISTCTCPVTNIIPTAS